MTPGATPTSPVVATVVFENGKLLRGGDYTVVIDSGTGNAGNEDNAGKAISGNFYGTFPSGDGRPGGDFVALIATIHDVVEPFVPSRDGYVPRSSSVIDPPKPSTVSRAHPGTQKKTHPQAAHTPARRSTVVRAPKKTPVKPATTSAGHDTHDKALESLAHEPSGKARRH